ncbi:MAG: cellulose 1,4-beta-cellobiosidase [Actinomycetota bacterium]|nr:cellulose 1,4-beta-cellobiosidase [Actinomycetota bacterium]
MTTPLIPRRRLIPHRRLIPVLAVAAVVGSFGLAPPAVATPPSPGVHAPHLDNPYAGATAYVDPEWRANAERQPEGRAVSATPTALWIDEVAKIGGKAGSMGLRAHLDAALAQKATLVQVVLDDLPGPRCLMLNPAGDFAVGEIERYRKEFIDPIAAIESDPRYGSLRIVNVLEPQAVAGLIVGVHQYYGIGDCLEQQASGDHVAGLRHALNALRPYSNLYTYVDMAHRGILGWPENFTHAADLLVSVVKGTTAGLASLDGITTDVAGYSALTEPFFTSKTTVGGRQVLESKWIDWNPYADELSFAQALRTKLVSLGFAPGLGVVIDTSRNGWGGPARPTKASTSTDVNQFVDQSRVDRRFAADDWCNQAGAGLGEPPRTTPSTGIDAYAWIKAPGVSDGASTWADGVDTPGLEPMCDPRYSGTRSSPRKPGALPNAPAKGTWFPEHFRQLLANTYTPLPPGTGPTSTGPTPDEPTRGPR